ncbi:Rqc2 family fibronectin-binding protein [Bacillus taeanensis]|uniref:Rqc2 homolog RqcH n=1 Tax=Bacillus taeanensis TaxID=273032 RepID=A0A366XRV5_9BACI|nr:NFACT RNA binding domain-containing protein [Bacillus taeanensis]RBW67499.1 hypothetical protein DS031_21690 [Bacillus taeanensis]
MAFDGIVTRAITKELAENLTGGRVNKIYQPYKTDLIFNIRANGKSHQLFLSASANFSRVHLTKESYENPKQPPMFCMLLRKHLEGSILEKVEQVNNDRVIHFTFQSKNEIGDKTERILIAEIMGKHSNIILIDSAKNNILDSIKHVSPAQNRHRTLMPGQPYVAPPEQDKISPFEADEEVLLRKLDFNSGRIDRQLVNIFSGLSPLITKEIIHRSGFAAKTRLPHAFLKVMNEFKNHHYQPEMVLSKQKEAYSVLSLTHLEGERKTFNTISDLLDRFYFQKASRDRIKQQANDLEKFLQNERNKNEKKISKLEKTLQEADKADKYQLYGELLTANMYAVKRGDKKAEVMNYYDENQLITISLDPQKSPSENAQHYFKKYNKAKNSLSVVSEQIEKAKEEIDYFDRLIQQMEAATSSDVEEIREELEEEGYMKRKKRPQKKKNDKPLLERYISSEGIEILVGKNNKQNEYLTNKLARKDETWLHTKDIPGSHVVIRNVEFTEQTLIEAANLAAYFSKAKFSSSVPVDYTKIRYVKKPSGAKPGFVTYDNQQTVFVTPTEDLVRQLRSK